MTHDKFLHRQRIKAMLWQDKTGCSSFGESIRYSIWSHNHSYILQICSDSCGRFVCNTVWISMISELCSLLFVHLQF